MTAAAVHETVPASRGRTPRSARVLWGALMACVVALLCARMPAVERELGERVLGAEAPAEADSLDPAYMQLALQTGAGAALAISIVVSVVMLVMAMRVAARTRAAGEARFGRVSVPLVLLVVAPTTLLAHVARLAGMTGTVATVGLVIVALGIAGVASASVRGHRWRWPSRMALAGTCALVFALF